MNGDPESRTITLQVSDKDMKRLCELAMFAGSNVSDMLESLIGDLTGGNASGGSDERMILKQWYERYECTHSRGYTFPAYLLDVGMLENAIQTNLLIDEMNEALAEASDESEKQDLLNEQNSYEGEIAELIDEYREGADVSAAKEQLSLYMDELRKYDLYNWNIGHI